MNTPGTAVDLSILTFNIWDFPIWLPGLDRKSRLARLPAGILSLAPDIICLQEAWKVKNRTRLVEALGMQHHSPVGTVRTPAPLVSLDTTGGLFVISRHAMADHEFVPFPRIPGTSLIEELARKGVLCSRLSTPAGDLWVVNTHLFAGHSDLGTEQRMRQLGFLLDTVDRVCGRDAAVILAGDLNAMPTRPFPAETDYHFTLEYERLLANGFTDTLPRFDASTVTYATSGNQYAAKWYHPTKSPSRVSYVLFRPSATMHITTRDARVVFNTGEPLSDHCGLLCEIELARSESGDKFESDPN
jgi:endonuclease/exonuclease/phosphatase family metal-dependent hydrolase